MMQNLARPLDHNSLREKALEMAQNFTVSRK
jgi:hypothetical protein